MNILITSAGRRVSLVKAFRKELKKIDPKGKVIASDANPLLAAACQVADDYFEVPLLDKVNYIQLLLEHCLKHEIKLIVPTLDPELILLAKNKSLFEENGIKVVVSTPQFIRQCRDKRVIHDFFTSAGILVAKEYTKDKYKLPLFIKPYDGSRSIDTYIIKTEKDLREYHFQNDKLMFLEYLDHAKFEEFTCDLYYNRGGFLKCVIPRKRIEVRDGEVNKGLTVRNELVTFIKEHLGHIEGAVGCLTSQFFKHKNTGDIYGIEINPRFGGGYPLSYLAGANFPKWIMEEYFFDTEIDDKFDCWESDLLMLRYDHEVLVHGYKG